VSSPPPDNNTAIGISSAALLIGLVVAIASFYALPSTNFRLFLFGILIIVSAMGGIILLTKFALHKFLAVMFFCVCAVCVVCGVKPLLPTTRGGGGGGPGSTPTPGPTAMAVADAARQLEAGMSLFRQGQYRQAVEKFKEAARGEDVRFEANVYMGQCYLKLQDYKAAKEPLHAAYGIKADDEIKRLLAHAYYSSGVECLNHRDKHGAVREQEFLKDYDSGMAEKLADLIGQP
jgi:Tetratricopeptide repeat